MPTASTEQECHVRKQVIRMIEQSRADGTPETALRLASETIRLARLAASTHMVLEAHRLHAEARLARRQP